MHINCVEDEASWSHNLGESKSFFIQSKILERKRGKPSWCLASAWSARFEGKLNRNFCIFTLVICQQFYSSLILLHLDEDEFEK